MKTKNVLITIIAILIIVLLGVVLFKPKQTVAPTGISKAPDTSTVSPSTKVTGTATQAGSQASNHVYTSAADGFSIAYQNIQGPSSDSVKNAVHSIDFSSDHSYDDAIVVFSAESSIETATGYGAMVQAGTATFGGIHYTKYLPANKTSPEVFYLKTGLINNKNLLIAVNNPKNPGVATYLDLATLITK